MVVGAGWEGVDEALSHVISRDMDNLFPTLEVYNLTIRPRR